MNTSVHYVLQYRYPEVSGIWSNYLSSKSRGLALGALADIEDREVKKWGKEWRVVQVTRTEEVISD